MGKSLQDWVGWCEVRAGRQIHWEPGNQVPTKCISSSEFFGRIHTLFQVDRFNRRM